jgi:integrase
MGSIYRRKEWHCVTSDCPRRSGGKATRLRTTADRTACQAAGHAVEERESPVWWVYYSRSGRGFNESSGSERKADAKALLVTREGDIARGKPVTPKVGKTTFQEAADDLLTDFRVNRRRSLEVVERRVRKHLTPFFDGWRMANITTADVRRYVQQRQSATEIVRSAYELKVPNGATRKVPESRRPIQGASNAEINRELALLKRMFTLAMQAGKVLHKPHIPMLAENNARAGFFEPEQLASVLRHLPAEIRPVIEFANVTGWRINSEVLPLQWRQVDFAAGEVRLDVGSTKNGEARTFPMTAELRRILKQQHAEHLVLKAAGQLMPNVFFRMVAEGRGGPKRPRPITAFVKAWKTATVAAGCPGRIPHDLRRTAIRALVRAGIPERVAMTLSGHKTRSVFERYNIVSEGDLREAARKLDAAASR